MGLNGQLMVFRMVLFMGLVGLAVSDFISDDVFKRQGSTFTLADDPESKEVECPVDFKKQNYTILTSKCKGPAYDADRCCSAFKEFACPFAKEINDVEHNNCALRMWDNIQVYKYPADFFYGKCDECKKGLECPN
ncbi:hypothetical protein LUZ63_008333 [Rhynchospora breviuscula]|uniref:GPI-anchored protein LLG1-like domain-containing protein n=1 Tax=Rhynchospora breviuscula TaxID=2022672 RepID=A0A9Q0HVE5_9POAL|nr:hypothetical protein LUZ63_008333 [Rhynchospora breviuscula]